MARRVTQTVRELEDARRSADAANDAKSSFLRNMSHEIRTPMNAVLGMTELLRRTPLSENQKQYADHVLAAGNHLLDLLNDILDLNRMEAGKVELEDQPLDLKAEIETVAAMLRTSAEDKGLALTVTYDPELAHAFCGDGIRLRQILVNLIGNAVKFTHTGRVDIIAVRGPADALEPARQHVRIEVRDTGIGIPEEKQAAIFGEFEQADASTTRRFGGTGLGLAICKRIVALMGGQIGVESTVGKGSTFWLDLSLEAMSDDEFGRLSERSREAVPLRPGIKVLVAEDNPANQIVIEGLLEGLGAAVHIANNGQEAVEQLRNHGADLILMDITMPVMDGLAATKAIRALCEPDCHVPIIALTAHAMPGDGASLLAMGMNDYVAKPVRETELRRALAQWANQAPPAAHPPAEADDTELANSRVLEESDFEDLTQRLGEARMRAVVLAALPAFSAARARLEDALEQADMSAAANAVHEIRGSASTLGAARLAETAARIEEDILSGAFDADAGDVLDRELEAAAKILKDRIAS